MIKNDWKTKLKKGKEEKRKGGKVGEREGIEGHDWFESNFKSSAVGVNIAMLRSKQRTAHTPSPHPGHLRGISGISES